MIEAGTQAVCTSCTSSCSPAPPLSAHRPRIEFIGTNRHRPLGCLRRRRPAASASPAAPGAWQLVEGGRHVERESLQSQACRHSAAVLQYLQMYHRREVAATNPASSPAKGARVFTLGRQRLPSLNTRQGTPRGCAPFHAGCRPLSVRCTRPSAWSWRQCPPQDRQDWEPPESPHS